jgi:hypothetical protein
MTGAIAVRAILKVAAVAAVAAVLCTIVAFVSLSLSFKVGRLSLPPTYDDVEYFVGAAQWLSSAAMRSAGSSLYALLDQHSPFTTLTAAIGLTWMPKDYVGPYAINAVIVAVFLLGIARLVWHLPLVDIATCLIGTACVPMLSHTITEARPDLPWGLGMGLAVGAILYRPLSRRSNWSIFFLGMLSGLAVALKPSAVVASVPCLVFAVLAASLCDFLESGMREVRTITKCVIKIVLIFAIGLVAAAAPIMGVHFRDIIDYIVQVLITEREFWATSRTISDHLTFYSVGDAGRAALGYWFWVGVALFAIRLGLQIYRNRSDLWRESGLLAVVAGAYAVPTLSMNKSYFLGAVFYGPYIVAMSLNYAAIIGVSNVTRLDKWQLPATPRWLIEQAPRFVSLAIVVFVFVSQVAAGHIDLATKFDSTAIQDVRTATERVWSLLLDSLPAEARPLHTPVIAFSSPYPVTGSDIELRAMQSHIKLEVQGIFFYRTVDEAVKDLSTSDFAIVTSSLPSNLPVPGMGDEIIRRLDADSKMCVVDSIPLLATRELRIYHNGPSGC